MTGRHKPKQSRKAGSSGLFCYGVCVIFVFLALADAAAAEPLAIEVVDAQAGFDQRTSEPVISFKMSPDSQRSFAAFTQANVGHKVALRIDGKTVSEPAIREPILGGSGQISGHFTAEQARDIAAKLISGKSKLEMEIVN
jgi:preprotein translocase subunit SecD